MPNRIQIHQLNIHPELYAFIGQEVLDKLEIEAPHFWKMFSEIVYKFTPRNIELLATRNTLQNKIDDWLIEHKDNFNPKHYEDFLRQINYLVPEPADFKIRPQNVDTEISTLAGPQLVVPVNNARYAINAANSRWGSLYDAFYGTDVIANDGKFIRGAKYNPLRGKEVIRKAWNFLDKAAPLAQGYYADIKEFNLDKDKTLILTLTDNTQTKLKNPQQFCAYKKEKTLNSILLKNNHLHIEIIINPKGMIGATQKNGVNDIVLESAITVIQDFEDSVTAVDAEDKTQAYRNWLQLMQGNLSVEFSKKGKNINRSLKTHRQYIKPNGDCLTLPGLSLMLVRNVGHLPTHNAITLENDKPIFEGIMDGIISSLIALHDIKNNGLYKNSPAGSVYIVKPKMHGPLEVKFTVDLFIAIEKAFDLNPNTLKIGIMDEERRTSANLKACIEQAKDRIIFINTGFLDRTGDEIHTSIQAGPMPIKAKIKAATWLKIYEDQNVDIGLACGFQGYAQIGKGMWAMPDEMHAMLDQKIEHPLAGANCAWVPSPTAATLHALHYHQVNVDAVQQKIKSRPKTKLKDLLHISLLQNKLSKTQIQTELDNNAQSILGYVVKWIDQGIGCSKVLDINNIGLMEDRATLRISSQHIANWLLHNLCSPKQVHDTFKRMAKIVDEQNQSDPHYQPMADDFTGLAFTAALTLALEGKNQPNGYTEIILNEFRLRKKIGVKQ